MTTIASWNLAGGKKSRATELLGGEIAHFQERQQEEAIAAGEIWCGDLAWKGISFRIGEGYQAAPLTVVEPLPRYFVPMQISGRESFQLIGVWAQNEGSDRYVRGVVRAVRMWRDRIAAQPTVIVGDFNANACWDGEHPAECNFSALARELDELGLVSAYHVWFGEAFGKETRPTFFLYRHATRPFHLDYCFIPRDWVVRLKDVRVGTHEEWGKRSDHMPIWVDFE